MAAERLCCTAEQRAFSSSPELPNARITEANPMHPLLDNRVKSNNSRFTSARTEDLIELREIFNNAADTPAEKVPHAHPEPPLKKSRSRHNLAKIKSVHALIKRKMSRDLSRNKPNTPIKVAETIEPIKDEEHELPGTVVKTPNVGPHAHFKPTKEDLRKNLLSDKEPDEGGYDSDAKVLNDVAKQIGGKSPSKRPSVHDIQWAPSFGSKQTLTDRGLEKYGERPSWATSTTKVPDHLLSARSNLSFTAPDLRQAAAAEDQPEPTKDFTNSLELLPPARYKPYASSPNLRHAVGKAAVEAETCLPPTPDMEPAQLPSFSSPNTSLWAQSLEESLSTPQTLRLLQAFNDKADTSVPSKVETAVPNKPGQGDSNTGVINIGLDFHAPNLEDATNQKENSAVKDSDGACQSTDESENSRNSVHLQNMRLSQHLRSGSLLSWGDQSEDSRNERPLSNVESGLNLIENMPGRGQYHRQTSSTGFDSCKVPSRWGSVIRPESTNGLGQDPEARSSVYSSRPQSPPDSPGFIQNVTPIFSNGYQPVNGTQDATTANAEPTQPSEDEETPKASKRVIVETPKTPGTGENVRKSKFKEEFGPEPPRRRLPKSKSVMKFLLPRSHVRDNVRSRSESNFVDGPDDEEDLSRGRQMSRSMMSLRTEQKALERQPDSSNMWEKALKAYHEERSSMFLSPNKALATRGSPFRERSSSFNRQHPIPETPGTERSESPGAGLFPSPSRRAAAVAQDLNVDPMADVRKEFHAQTESSAAVGAWGKYPSHSRPERTSSAGPRDDIQTRDFALEAAIKFAMGADIDPVDPSPETAQSKKKKKKVGTAITQSQSVSLGKQFIRNYTRMFRSQSTEFRRYGHGHRTSIAAGGTLEYPELEILPEVFASASDEQGSSEDSPRTDGAVNAVHDGAQDTQDTQDIKGKKKADDQQSPDQGGAIRVDSSSTVGLASEPRSSIDRARVWSTYYEDCVAEFPGNSMDTNGQHALSFGADSQKLKKRHSADVRVVSGHSAAKSNETSASLPSRLRAGHERNLSAVSVITEASGLSGSKSVSSVRQSTLDLLQIYRQREIQERERVLSMLGSSAH